MNWADYNCRVDASVATQREQTEWEPITMETVVATCPICEATHEYGAELIGRYTLCHSCRARFYVEVPPLAEAQGVRPIVAPKSPAAAKPDTTLDDLLWDTQQGTRYIIQSLRRQDDIARTVRWLVAAVFLLGLANLAGIVLLWLR
jgi:hypothetical protein